MAELSQVKETIAQWLGLRTELQTLQAQLTATEELIHESGNEESSDIQELLKEARKKTEALKGSLDTLELAKFLSGPYDAYSATVTVLSGAGGIDAADWAGMLVRMFQRFGERRGWKVRLLHEHQLPEGGVKSATLELDGKDAYGWLRREAGVHRLVRISPYDSSKRRHTSFALVETLPVLPPLAFQDFQIKPEDLHIETSRSSGPGGQNVNRRETAVRIVHLPSGLVVECQAERTQGSNRERAMAMLRAKLIAQREAEHHETLRTEKGGRVDAAWGNQIRSYVLHPYKLVKDHRTNVEHHDPIKVLDGDLQSFIEAEVRI